MQIKCAVSILKEVSDASNQTQVYLSSLIKFKHWILDNIQFVTEPEGHVRIADTYFPTSHFRNLDTCTYPSHFPTSNLLNLPTCTYSSHFPTSNFIFLSTCTYSSYFHTSNFLNLAMQTHVYPLQIPFYPGYLYDDDVVHDSPQESGAAGDGLHHIFVILPHSKFPSTQVTCTMMMSFTIANR